MSQDTATAPASQSLASLNGQVKWFNNHLNYGFITSISEGEYKGLDIFVHQSNIRASGYRTLQNGEYVEFDLIQNAAGDKHPYHASNVSGINGGKLMCEIARPTGGNYQGTRTAPSFRGGADGASNFRPYASGGSDEARGDGTRGGRGRGGFRGGRGAGRFQTSRGQSAQQQQQSA